MTTRTKSSARADRIALYAAAGFIIVLTNVAFWLSYAHLADVAGAYGLESSVARQWAWPATLDLFIVAGEVLMFRAALRKETDPWAIALTVVGSVGSIALNVAGVGTRAPVLNYVVAAVPPTAALLAFGALMRQVHSMVTDDAADTAPDTVATVADTSGHEAPVSPDMAAGLLDILPDLAALSASDAPVSGPVVSAPSAPASTSVRGRNTADIKAAVAYLEDTGQELTGDNLAEYLGVSGRTGRRYLKELSAA